jgi:hypothetical protein
MAPSDFLCHGRQKMGYVGNIFLTMLSLLL